VRGGVGAECSAELEDEEVYHGENIDWWAGWWIFGYRRCSWRERAMVSYRGFCSRGVIEGEEWREDMNSAVSCCFRVCS
jgi:hypothetical protein